MWIGARCAVGCGASLPHRLVAACDNVCVVIDPLLYAAILCCDSAPVTM